MKVRCPNCRTLYRIDPAPVPVGEKTARCGRCAEVFRLAEHTVAPVATPEPAAAPQPRPVAVHHAAATGAGRDEGRFITPPEPVPSPSTTVTAPVAEPAPPPATTAPAANASATTDTPPSTFRFFGPQDPHQRARHLARALVSDIVAYYPERLERSRATGNLREEFREEVLKSWEEYVLQVGAEFARETDHFQTALNDILAQGEKVF